VEVSTSRELHTALAGRTPRAIVLAPGTYDSPRPFRNANGHRLYAATLGRVVLKAGLSVGGNTGRGGGVVRGVVVDVKDRSKTVDGAGISVWGVGKGSKVLDTTLRGNGVLRAGILARQPEGLVIRRVVARRFTDYGVLVDANDLGRGVLPVGFRLEDVDVARVGRPVRGSSNGTAEACVWIGNTGSVRRVRARSCALMGLWTGTATRRATFDLIDVDRAATGVYIEHFTQDTTFQRLRVGGRVRVGLLAEWADPAWNGTPASVGNVVQDSRFESSLAGVYLDEGTTRTTIRRSTFVNQRWAAIGDYRGMGNSYYANDYRRIAEGAAAVSHDHLSAFRRVPR